MKRLVVLLASVSLLLGAFAPATLAGPPVLRGAPPPSVRSLDDTARQKLDPKLRKAVSGGSNATVAVFATVVGNPAAAMATLDGAHAARTPNGEAALVVGRIKVQQLPKLADQKNVLSVKLVQLKQTGKPLGNPDPDIGAPAPSAKAAPDGPGQAQDGRGPVRRRPAAQGLELRGAQEARSPRRQDPRLRRGLEDGLRRHRRQRFDPRRRHRLGPSRPHRHLADRPERLAAGLRPVRHARPAGRSRPGRRRADLVHEDPAEDRRTGRRREPAGHVRDPHRPVAQLRRARRHGQPHVHVPGGLVEVRARSASAAIPTTTCSLLYGERPAFLVTDPNVAGVYDTVYVDLDDDHDFSDEKPITKASPVSYRDLNGDGYTDMSGGLLYYISDGTTGTPAAGRPRGVRPRGHRRPRRAARLDRRLRPGDRRATAR